MPVNDQATSDRQRIIALLLRKIQLLTLLALLAGAIWFILNTVLAYAGECDGTVTPCGGFVPKNRTKEVICRGVKYKCVGCGGCVPVSTGSTPSTRSSGRSPKSFSQGLMMGLMQSFMDGFTRGLQNGSAAQRPGDDEEERLRKIEEEKRLAEWKAKVQEQMQDMQKQYTLMKEEEFKESRRRLLPKLKGVDTTAGRHPSSGSLRNLACSHYWSTRASEETDDERARLYSEYAAQAMAGETARCPNDLNVPLPSGTPSYDQQFKTEFYEVFVQELNERVSSALRLRRDVEASSQKIEQVRGHIKQLEAKKATAQENEKQYIDTLLAEANALLQEATEQDKKAKETLDIVNKEIIALKEIDKTLVGMEAKR